MIYLRLLGGLVLTGPDPTPSARSQRRHPLALLALMAAAGPLGVGRDRLMAHLWPESDTERASNSLRQTLFWLRRDLGDDVFLPEKASGLRLDPSRISVDLWAFHEAAARGAPERSVELYAGPFLNGFVLPGAAEFSRWAESERETLERKHLSLLDALGRRAEEEGRWEEAVQWARRRAAAEPFSSRSALALLKALIAAGDRPGALEYASVYEAIVRSHLESTPDPTVAEFVAALRCEVAQEDAAVSEDDHRIARAGDGVPLAVHREIVTIPAAVTREIATAPAATARATATVPATAPASPAGPRIPRRLPTAWLIATGVLVVAMVSAAGGSLVLGPADDTTMVLASATRLEGGRDPGTQLIACRGPACPGGDLPQNAFVVAKHEFYHSPAAGSGYVAPVADGTIAPLPGYACCTIATFEHVFELPAEAAAGRIIVTLLADNQAKVALNGVEFGRQPEPWDVANYIDGSVFTTEFPPAPGGTNRLRITLWDGGGALALHYHAVVTYEVAPAAVANDP